MSNVSISFDNEGKLKINGKIPCPICGMENCEHVKLDRNNITGHCNFSLKTDVNGRFELVLNDMIMDDDI